MADDHFLHLARLALSGQRSDVVTLIRRVAWRCRETDPDLSAALRELVKDEPTQAPLRAWPEEILHKVNGGGGIQPPRIDDDSILVQLSPGSYSLDGGETWHEDRSETTGGSES